VSFASEPFLEEINKNQIIPRLDSLALSSYASTNKTNSMAVRAYKNDYKIDDKDALIHCPSSTEMMKILRNDNVVNSWYLNFKDLRTIMLWHVPGLDLLALELPFTNEGPDLSGYKLNGIFIYNDKLECRYTKKDKITLTCFRSLRSSMKHLIVSTWAPLNPDCLADREIVDYFGGLLIKGKDPDEYEPSSAVTSKLLAENEQEGVDLVFNQTRSIWLDNLKSELDALLEEINAILDRT
jgi:hypothetical protein